LVDAFAAIKDDPDGVARTALGLENDEVTYYRVRSWTPASPIERAARFLYLNHTSFNGIYRVNLAGTYNVPFGRRRWVNIPSAEHLRQVSARLSRATLRTADFASCAEFVGPDDLVFLDPPYTVAHNNNGFVKYNQNLFSFEDQARLSVLIDVIKSAGAYYILTNAAHPSIAELFEKGDHRRETNRRNTIGGVNASRGAATEYLFTNLGADE
jgi:DNA adenine methylase